MCLIDFIVVKCSQKETKQYLKNQNHRNLQKAEFLSVTLELGMKYRASLAFCIRRGHCPHNPKMGEERSLHPNSLREIFSPLPPDRIVLRQSRRLKKRTNKR